jgi:hypothetical protein
MQVDTTSREGPGRALEQAAQAYLRSLRGKRRDESPPSLSEETIDTLRQVITSDLGGRASLHVRRRLVLDEFARRLELALGAAALDEETAARVARHVQEELREKLPTTN